MMLSILPFPMKIAPNFTLQTEQNWEICFFRGFILSHSLPALISLSYLDCALHAFQQSILPPVQTSHIPCQYKQC